MQTKLDRMATEQGRPAEALVKEAVERVLDGEGWFFRQVEQGLAAAERGEFIEHEDVAGLLERRYPA